MHKYMCAIVNIFKSSFSDAHFLNSSMAFLFLLTSQFFGVVMLYLLYVQILSYLTQFFRLSWVNLNALTTRQFATWIPPSVGQEYLYSILYYICSKVQHY